MKLTHADLRDVLRTPYVAGGRCPGRGLDCLGTVLVIAERMHLPAPDPWSRIAEAWRANNLQAANGFAAGWQRISNLGAWQDGDVLLYYEHHPWSAIVCADHVWSADPRAGGVWSAPLHRWHKVPAEAWRYGEDQGLGPARTDR